MYGWGASIGGFHRRLVPRYCRMSFIGVAPEGVTFVSTNLVIRDARESSQVCGEIRVWPGLIAGAHTRCNIPSLPPPTNLCCGYVFRSVRKNPESLRAGQSDRQTVRTVADIR